jgi:UDP-N-acetylglucosamine 4-epimerase
MHETKYHTGDLSDYSFAVTGGAGFIGSHLTEYLLRHNAKRVVILDDLSTGSLENIESFKTPSLDYCLDTICNPEACENAFKDIDFVLHQAALCSVPRSMANPLATHEVNVTGFLNVLQAAVKCKVKRVVYASSSSVYGDSKSLPKRETDLCSPLSPYAASKLCDELYASVFSRNFHLQTVGLRYFNIFGPRQNPEGQYAAAIPLFITALLKGKTPIIYGDGKQTRDFTFIENVVQANIRALFAENISGEVFNIAVGQQTSVNELYDTLCTLAGARVEPHYSPTRKGDVTDSRAAIEKAEKMLSYSPHTDFRKGIELTWNWFNSKNALPLKKAI